MKVAMMKRPWLRPCLLLAAASLSACEVGPNYHRPSAPTPGAYREIEGWAPAKPSDAADRRDWWTVFSDPVLDQLEKEVETSNQTLAAAEAAYRQAHALVAVQRAALFPTITGQFSPSVSGKGSGGAGGAIVTGGSSPIVVGATGGTTQSYRLLLGASWEPDLWGRVRRSIENAKATAQGSAADLANARLSAQLETAADYVQLRQLDEDKRLLDSTVAAYQQNLVITQNKYRAGTVSMGDVRQAETQLYNTRASDTDVDQQRAKLEHAIAILTGRPPAEVTIAPAPWNLKPIDIPPGLPSTLLERRPDIAAAERRAEAASANIGVQTAAYFPTLDLTGSGGYASSRLASLFSSSSVFWTAGATAAETILDFGARHGEVSAARAAYDEAVANYRQAVLTAFGQVEDNLAAQRVLATEQADRQAALEAADDAVRIARNQYNAGTVDYITVVVAQAAALSAHQTEISLEAARLTTTVDLIVALGGGWNEASLPRS
jgi:NodT family efflux transporter outer membrane factor (OMF) lipoprotein